MALPVPASNVRRSTQRHQLSLCPRHVLELTGRPSNPRATGGRPKSAMTIEPGQAEESVLSREALRALIVESLAEQGYEVGGRRPIPPADMEKARVRALNAAAVEHRRDEAARNLARYEGALLARVANGSAVVGRQSPPLLSNFVPYRADAPCGRSRSEERPQA
jgi:hypothetical protein